MEEIETINPRHLTAPGSVRTPGFDIDEVYFLDGLTQNGLCSDDNEAKLAHTAVFDAEADKLFTIDSSSKIENKRTNAKIESLKKIAAEFCAMCVVSEDCTEFATRYKKLTNGVYGGLEGPKRTKIAAAKEVTQVKVTRIRGAKNGLAEAV